MKFLLGILAIALIFGYIFVQSHAWDVDTRTVDKEGVDVDKRRHTIHWDRFFQYIKDIPRKIIRHTKQLTGGDKPAMEKK